MKPEEKIERAYEELRAIIDGGSESFTHEDAVQYLKNRLAQPEQEKERCVGCEACINTACGRDECPKGWPKAPQRKPLTEYEIDCIRFGITAAHHTEHAIKLTRAIEAAHGIKENT